MNEKRPLRIHPTILTALCWQAVKFRYVLGLRKPPDVARVIGIATHETYKTDLRYKASLGPEFGAGLPDEDVDDAAATAFEHAWTKEGEVVLDEEEAERGVEKVRGAAKDQVVGLARLAHAKLTPGVEVESPRDVERRIDLAVSGAPFNLSGILDVHERGRETLRDTKTRGRKPSPDDAAASIQLAFYAFALERYGTPVRTVGLDVLVKTKKPGGYSLRASAPKDYAPLLERIRIAAGIFETGLFYPIDPTSQTGKWACTKRFCGYWQSDCPFGRAARASVSFSNL